MSNPARRNLHKRPRVAANNEPAPKELKPIDFNKTIGELIEFILSSNQSLNNAASLNEIAIVNREFEAHNMTFNSTMVKESILKSVDGATGIYSEIAKEVRGKFPSLMFEAASRHGNHVFLVNLSYAMEEKLVKRTIGFITQNQQQTARDLVYQIELLLTKVGLTLDDIYSVCTDQGANILKVADLTIEAIAALKLCRGIANLNDNIDQDINRTREEEREDEREDRHMLREEMEVDREVQQQQQAFEEEVQTVADIVVNEGALSTKIICGAHFCHLAVKEVIKDYEPVIAEIRAVVKTSWSDEFVLLLHAAKVKRLQLDAETREKSLFQMISSIHRFRTQLEQIALNEERLRLSENAWQFINDYLQVFTPVHLAMKDFQRADITVSDFYISWVRMELNIRRVAGGNEQLKAKLLGELNQRKQKFFESDVFVAALLLDPRINWSQNPEDFYGPAMCERGILLLEKVHHVINGLQDQEGDQQASEEEELRQLLGWEQFQGIRQRVNRFLADPRLHPSAQITPLKYWYNRRNEQPEIYKLSQVVYGAAFSEIKDDKFFSGFALVLPALKMLLGDDDLNAILVCKNNLDLLEKVKFV